VLLCGVLAGCSFQGPPTTVTTSDARGVVDAAPTIDAVVRTSCTLGAGAPITDRGKVGLSTGGALVAPPLACDGDTRIVGVALDMSNGLADSVTVSAHGIRIACATVSIDALGAHTGTVATKDVEGNGGSGWTPSTFTAITSCPAGAVVSGLSTHGSTFTTYFLDANITCSTFNARGQLLAATSVHIAGSQTSSANPSGVVCNAGEQLAALSIHAGAGLDSANLQCAPVTCE